MTKKKIILIVLAIIIPLFFFMIINNQEKKNNIFSINNSLDKLNLRTHKGETLKAASILKAPSLFFFGFLNCPDICPNTLLEISEIIKKLEEDSQKVNFYFVTVDPERDDAVSMAEYLKNFNENIIGITGNYNNLEKFLKDMHVYYEKIYIDENFYTMDHSSQIFIFKRNGNFFGTISTDEKDSITLEKIRSLI